MECLRCHGMMVEERFEDLRGDPHHISFRGMRCVNCGNVDDPTMLYNRSNQAVAVLNNQPIPKPRADKIEAWKLDIEAA